MSDPTAEMLCALAELERAEDDPAAAAEVGRCRARHEAAEVAAVAARARRRQLKARLAPREVERVHVMLAKGRRG